MLPPANYAEIMLLWNSPTTENTLTHTHTDATLFHQNANLGRVHVCNRDEDEVTICHRQTCVNPKWRRVVGFKQQQHGNCKWTECVCAWRQPDVYTYLQRRRCLKVLRYRSTGQLLPFTHFNPRSFFPSPLVFSPLSFTLKWDDTIGTGSAESNVSCLLIFVESLNVKGVCVCASERRGLFFWLFDVSNLSNVLIKVLSRSSFLLIKWLHDNSLVLLDQAAIYTLV